MDLPFDILNSSGHYVPGVVSIRRERSQSVQGATSPSSYIGRNFSRRRLNSTNGSWCLTYDEDGSYRFVPPRAFSACKAATLGEAMDACLPDPKKIATRLYVNWGRDSHRQLVRVLADFDGAPWV